MKRIQLLTALALIGVAPAGAQMIKMQPVRPNVPTVPLVVAPADEAEPKVDLVVADPDRARELIEKLRRDKRELNAKLKEALAKIDQITVPGGSLVRAYCADAQTSRNTAGGEEKCERYTCNKVSGLCNQSATSGSMCAPNFHWVAGDRCVTLEEAQKMSG